MITTFLTGMGTGAGLIIAIGAQNTLVLTQGIRKQYIYIVPLLCSLCDVLLISAGIAGMGTLVETSPLLISIAAGGGAVFLFLYGLKSFVSAYRNANALSAETTGKTSRSRMILTTLAITLLNPHVYLDTVVLLGGISGTFPGAEKYYFGAGAVTTSFLWFFSLSLGAVKLAPFFKKPRTWRILDTLIGMIMWVIAFKLGRMALRA
jgi:L-lysine exporter family protein LysE/ArgO